MNKKVLTGIIIAIVAVVLITVVVLKSTGSISAFGGGNAYSVKAARIAKSDISSYVSSSGIVEEVEKAEVFFDTPLKVQKVFVGEGRKVTSGQKILDLDMDSLNSELEKLKINKKIQELSLNSTVSGAEADRADSSVKNAERAYNDSKKTYLNNKELYAANAISKNDLDMSEKAYIQSEAALKDARTAYGTAVESRNINRATAEANLNIINLSISDLEKRIQKIDKDMTSPIDGVVAQLNVEEGNFTGSMQSAYRIINPDKLQVKANIKEYDIKNIAVGQTVRITGDAIDKEASVRGKVSGISPVAVVNRTASGEETVVEVTIAIDGAGNILKPGLNVTCDIYTVEKKDVLVAPMEMITEDKDGNKLVFVINTANSTMVQKQVTLGINSDMNVEITGGLKEGDLVVLEPQPMYRDGSKVRLQDN